MHRRSLIVGISPTRRARASTGQHHHLPPRHHTADDLAPCYRAGYLLSALCHRSSHELPNPVSPRRSVPTAGLAPPSLDRPGPWFDICLDEALTWPALFQPNSHLIDNRCTSKHQFQSKLSSTAIEASGAIRYRPHDIPTSNPNPPDRSHQHFIALIRVTIYSQLMHPGVFVVDLQLPRLGITSILGSGDLHGVTKELKKLPINRSAWLVC